MENASKALIIAGAILISILLISVGVIIMNSTGNTKDTVTTQATTTEIESFNSQFTPYQGQGQSASQVRALIAKVRASNASNTNRQINVLGRTGNTAFNTVGMSETAKYNVSLEYSTSGNNNGCVNIIRIWPQT